VVKVGVIGLGYWGPKIARNFHELADAQLEWVCDLDQSRLDHITSLYPEVRATRDYWELLASDVDAVVIATPVRGHYPLAMDALHAGKHVLVEKPLSACVEQAGEIVAEGKRQSRIVMVGHTFIYNPAVRAVKEIIDSGILGRIYYINGVRVNLGLFQPDINVVWDLAPHDISILMFILGMTPVEASARGEVCVQKKKALHDVAHISFFFPNGITADIQVSWLDPCKIRRYTVVGSQKMLVYDDLEPLNKKVLVFDKGVNVPPPYSDTQEEFHVSYRQGEGIPYAVEWVEPLKLQCQDFVNCILIGQEPSSDGTMGKQIVRILETVQHSLLNGGQREVVGESRGFCANRARREAGPRCKDLCLRESLWL
jgi:predicted dehydrogenase